MTDPFPKWARWIAQNKLGSIYVFDKKPDPGCSNWLPAYGGMVKCIHSIDEYDSAYRAMHWRHSLDYLGEDDE